MPKKEPDIYEQLVSRTQLSKILGVSNVAIGKWNLPEYKTDGGRTAHKLGEAVERRIKNVSEQLENHNETITASRAKLVKMQAKREEQKYLKEHGQLIPVDVIELIWSNIVLIVVSKLKLIPSKYQHTILSCENEKESSEMLRKAINEPIEAMEEWDIDQYIKEMDIPDDYNQEESSQEEVIKKTKKKTKRATKKVTKKTTK
jgi:phage terminase Nu1 subunit (DNA packaging protein)